MSIYKSFLREIHICLFWGFTIFVSCSYPENNKNIIISLEYGDSYRIDITDKKYTVFYMDRDPLVVKINLTDDETTSIVNKYYSLLLEKLPDVTSIEDSCLMMPKIYTVLTVKSNKATQKITIDGSCKSYYPANKTSAQKVLVFIKHINSIVFEKKEIKDVLPSNIIYM